jgi:hypothetical protein
MRVHAWPAQPGQRIVPQRFSVSFLAFHHLSSHAALMLWQGGHRVPGIVAWPAVVKGPARSSWDTVITSDFLPTIMEILAVERPPSQRGWAMDGVSILPILRGEPAARRCIGHNFNDEDGKPCHAPLACCFMHPHTINMSWLIQLRVRSSPVLGDVLPKQT